MSEYRFALEIEREVTDTPGPFSATPVSRLQRDIWDAMLRHSMRYVGEYQSIWSYLRRLTTEGEGWFEATDDTLTYTFPTFDGEARLSAAAAHHWMRRSASAIRKSLAGIAEQSDARLVGGFDDLRDMLEDPDELLVELRDEPWLIRLDGSVELVGDDASLAWADLDDDEKDTVGTVRERDTCGCRMCQQMRPDDAWEKAWRADLDSADLEERREASWFIVHSTNPSTELIEAAARQTDRAGLYRHLRAMKALGRRLPPGRLDELTDAVSETGDTRAQASLVACIAGMLLEPDARVEILQQMFDLPSPVAETAVEFLGYGEIPDATRIDITEALQSRVGEDDDLNYAIALTLYNIYRKDDYPPSVVKETLQKLAGQPGEAGEVAERALAWFDR